MFLAAVFFLGKEAVSIEAVREALLSLHKALIDWLRAEYERAQEKTLTPGELLQLLTGDAAFDWLHPFSMLIVAIDELLERELPPSERDAAAVRLEAERLISGEAAARFTAVVDRSVEVALEEGKLLAALAALPVSTPEQHATLLELRATWTGTRRRRSLKTPKPQN